LIALSFSSGETFADPPCPSAPGVRQRDHLILDRTPVMSNRCLSDVCSWLRLQAMTPFGVCQRVQSF